MKLKKFVASTTREALQRLRTELGDDAIILSTRQTSAGAEVLAASMQEIDQITAKSQDGQPKHTSGGSQTLQAPSWTRADREKLDIQTKRAEAVQRTIQQQIRDQTDYANDSLTYSPKSMAKQLTKQQAQSKPKQPEAKQNPVKPAKTVKPEPQVKSQNPEKEKILIEQEQVLEEIKQMRQLMKDQLQLMTWRDSLEQNPLRGEVWMQLNNAGFSPLFARKVAEKLPRDISPEKTTDWLMTVLNRNLLVASQKEDLVEQGGVYAFVGSTGVGKTTTTAKLAARCVVKYGADSLGLITTDSYRIGAQDQLRIYGKILGIQVYTAQNDADLKQLRNSLQRKRLILIDTVGMSQRDQRLDEHNKMLVDCHIKRLLLLNTTNQAENLDDVVRHYNMKGVQGAIITKLDESIKLGGTLDVLMRHKLKLFYMTTGQRVPEDLFMADSKLLVHRAIKPRNQSAFKALDQEAQWKMSQTSSKSSIT